MIIDKQTLFDLKQRWVKSIKLYFYDSWCEGTKLNIEENPDLENLELIENIDWIAVYSNKEDKDKFDDCSITRTVTADHTWKEKIRYIYSSNKVKGRCGCWSSFSFEEKKLKINLEKFKDLKSKFKK